MWGQRRPSRAQQGCPEDGPDVPLSESERVLASYVLQCGSLLETTPAQPTLVCRRAGPSSQSRFPASSGWPAVLIACRLERGFDLAPRKSNRSHGFLREMTWEWGPSQCGSQMPEHRARSCRQLDFSAIISSQVPAAKSDSCALHRRLCHRRLARKREPDSAPDPPATARPRSAIRWASRFS